MRLFHHTLLKEHQFRQLPVNDRTFVEVQESKGKDPVYKRDKETQDWTHWRGQEEQFHFTHVTFPPRPHSSALRKAFVAHDYSRGGKWEHVSKHPSFQVRQVATKETQFPLAPSRILK